MSRVYGVTMRKGIAVVVASISLLVVGTGSGANATAHSPRPITAHTAANAVSAGELESLFASEGIATVRSMSATGTVDPVTGPISMRFTTWQVQAMTEGAAPGSGVRGSALDAAHPVPAGGLPFSYVLAAWVSSGSSRGAAEVRSLMGPQDWSAAPSIVFPTVALPLFAADVIGAAQAGILAGAASPRSAAPPRSMLGIESPCSLVSGFIDDVMSTVFDALTLTSPPGSSLGTKIGQFFVDVWNTGLSYAQKAVSGLLKTVTEAVVKQIENMAAAASVIAEVVTNIGPWKADVTAVPPAITQGDGGSFKVKVTTPAGGTDYPTAVSDCAAKLGFTLPSLNAKKAPAKWKLSGPLSAANTTSVVLDSTGASTISYTTKSQPPSDTGSCSSGSPPGSTNGSESGVGSITVTRPAIGDIKGLLTNLLTTNVPVVGSQVQKILNPLIDEVLKRLDTLTEITGSAKVEIKEPSTTGGTTTGDSGCAACMVGNWTATSVSIGTTGSYVGGSGSRWIIRADGTETIDWDGSGYFYVGGAPIYSYQGQETEHVEIETGSSGKWSARVTADNRIALYDPTVSQVTGKKSEIVPSTAGVAISGRWVCNGNSMAVTATADGSTADVRLVRR